MKNQHFKDFSNDYTRGRSPKAPSAEQLRAAMAVIMASLHVSSAAMKATTEEIEKTDFKKQLFSIEPENLGAVFIGEKSSTEELRSAIDSVARELGDELFQAIHKEPAFMATDGTRATLGVVREILKSRKAKGEDISMTTVVDHAYKSLTAMAAGMGRAIMENIEYLCQTSLMFIRHGMEFRNDKVSQPLYAISGEFFYAYMISRIEANTGGEVSPITFVRDFSANNTGLQDVVSSVVLKAFLYAAWRYNKEIAPL